MSQRVITGIVAGAAFIGLLIWGSLPFQIFVGLLALVALSELFKMARLPILTLEGLLASLACLVLAMPFVSELLLLGKNGPFLLFGAVILSMLSAAVFSNGKYSFAHVSFPFLCAFYVGFGFQALNMARISGIHIVLFGIFIVWATDSGAYFVGRSLGRHKLIPSVSPNKTIEGALGGVLSAVAASFIMVSFFKDKLPDLPLFEYLLLAALFSCAAQLGDLVESSIKRQFNVKDSGVILPGHGGILDRFDSMLFVLPLMYLLGLF